MHGSTRHRHKAIVTLFAALPVLTVVTTAQAAPGEVAVLGTTVAGGLASPEAQHITAQGFTPVLISNGDWAAMTTADFASYEAVVLGDPNCSVSTTAISAAELNAATWASAVDGNVVIIGADPVWHINFGGDPGAQVFNDNALNFVLDDAGTGTTGAYIALSCYYHSSPSGTPVDVLDGFGDFTVTGAAFSGALNLVEVVASHPALGSLTGADLSNWNASVHEHFDTWPTDFEVLALAVHPGGGYTGPDGTIGDPYILARGVIPDLCGNGDLDPGEECDDGNNEDGDGCDAACNISCLDDDGDGTCNEDDLCPGADDNADGDGDGVPDACDQCPGADDSADEDGDGTPDACDLCPGGDDAVDGDGDGTPDACDLCPGSDDAVDADGDGVPDACDQCSGADDGLDQDGDGVPDACDVCADTMLPESVPTIGLEVDHYADVDGDGIFETVLIQGGDLVENYTLPDTGGCSCEQIIDELGLSKLYEKYGCHALVLDWWISMLDGAVAGDAAIPDDLVEVSALGAEVDPEPSLDGPSAPAAGCTVGTTAPVAGWSLFGLGLLGFVRRRRR